MEVQTPSQAFAAFLGALGFTRPVEQLELRSVPLPSLLSWLSRPNCCNLVEATTQAEEVKTTSACRSVAIAVSEEMLYKARCPLVGVGIVYTPPYLPRVPFSVAFMNLSVWRDAQVASENWLVGTRLMFINASEASEFLPVAEGHPVLLDASTTEVLGDIETSVSPLLLRGFQLHTVLVPHAEGGNTRNLVSPRFQGGNSSTLILYDEETVPQPDQSPPAKTAEAILIATRNELYGKDNLPVQEVRARLLGLDPDVTPTDAQINASPRFALRSAAAERDAPDIITDHWMLYLEENGRLADCSPEEFNATEGWVPLYTPEKLEEHLPAALSAFGSAKPPHLMAVVPPNFPLGMDKEFMLTSFHLKACLRRTSLTISGKRRQVAFCPYCGVTNDNAETGLNHVRKHLDVMLVCGGCHTKSVCLGQALQKHMKDNCPAVLAILGKTRGGKK